MLKYSIKALLAFLLIVTILSLRVLAADPGQGAAAISNRQFKSGRTFQSYTRKVMLNE